MYNKLPVKERIELMKSYRKANKDMSYRDMVKDYNDSYQKFRDGGKSDGMTGLMKSKIATEAHYGNPAALRMVSPNPNKYTFTGEEKDWKGNQASPAGSSGTHFMGSYGDQARPGLQEVNGKMQYFQNPPKNSKENFNFSRPEDAEYFAEHYKEVAPMMRNFQQHRYGGIQKFGDGGEFDDEGSIIKNKLSKNTLAKDERSNQDNTRVSNLPIKTLQALQQQADVERASRQQYKQQPVISQGKKLNPTEQAYSDKVQARIANPSNDLGITAANIASALTRFRYLNPEEIAATTNNPMGTISLSSGIMTEALANEMAGPAFGKALTSSTKVIKKVPKELPSFSNVDFSVNNIGKSIKQSSNKIDQSIIDNYTQREIDWLNSDEYIKRNINATGKSKEAVIKERNKIFDQINKTTLNVLDDKADMAAGVYTQDKKNPLINLFNTGNKAQLFNVADHEIKHAVSQQAIRNTDGLIDLVTNPYKKYPTVNVKKWYDNFIPGETTSKWASNAPEQQVVSKRIMDLVEKTQGVKRGTQLTEDNIKGVTDLLNKEIKNKNPQNSDIIAMLSSFKSKFGKNYYSIIKDMVNKAYIVPAVIGASTLQKTDK